MSQKNWLILGILIILCLAAAFFSINSYIYYQKQSQAEDVIQPYQATLFGTYICLPLVENAPAPDVDCTLGLMTEVGEYYAINFPVDLEEQSKQLNLNEPINVSGQITPIEMLSTDYWQQFPIKGIFAVETINLD